MNIKRLLACLAAVSLSTSATFASSNLAKWTFESLISGYTYTPGVGVATTNYVAETGAGIAKGLHAGNGVYSSPTGNGGGRALSSTVWAIGDYYQFAVSTIAFQNIVITFDQYSSATGPGQFYVAYSTDGSTFTQFGSVYTVASGAWTTYTVDLSSITALNNVSTIYVRLVDASTVSAGGATVGTGGTDRVDNFAVSASGLAGSAPAITTDLHNIISYWGNTVSLNVIASGSDPLSYQWYYPDLSHPLSDGGSGHGVGTITGSTSNTLTLAYIDPSQAGNYQVVITNTLGAVTSTVASVTVNVRTPIVTNIAFLRNNQDHINWAPIDTTNLYSVTGIVTTPYNTSASSAQFFMQDGSSGICVFIGGGTSVPNQGDLVRVIGPVANFDGLLEFNLSVSNPSHSVSSAISTGNPLPAVKYFDINKYQNIPYMETNIEGSLVVVSNVFLNQTSLQFPAGAMNITNVYRKYISFYVNANAYDVIGQNVPRIAASITGVMNQYTTATGPATNGYELDIFQYANLTAAASVPAMPLYISNTPSNAVVSWWAVDPFTLQAAPSLTGTYTNIVGATTPFTNSVDYSAKFYRLKQN